ncbi:hypothetical protein NE237_024803 [Protea cynaroides]|uniref:Uncharacterized protein n=1 Tax=Protea cynaroides TaxID=273540 RepID=A0A9Q0JZY6_9MAGN|nr:hypothetical protein NE237_024803 [Protea cynaroides]
MKNFLKETMPRSLIFDPVGCSIFYSASSLFSPHAILSSRLPFPFLSFPPMPPTPPPPPPPPPPPLYFLAPTLVWTPFLQSNTASSSTYLIYNRNSPFSSNSRLSSIIHSSLHRSLPHPYLRS